jgi:hypothetical protein
VRLLGEDRNTEITDDEAPIQSPASLFVLASCMERLQYFSTAIG